MIKNKDTKKKDKDKSKNNTGIEEVLEAVDFIIKYVNEKYKDKFPNIPTIDDFIDKFIQEKVSEELKKNSKKMEPLIKGTEVKAVDYSKYLSKLKNRENIMRLSSRNDPWGTYQSVGGARYLTPKECKIISEEISKEVKANVKEDFVKNKLALAMGTYQTRTNAEQRNINEETEQRLLKLEKENEQLGRNLERMSDIYETFASILKLQQQSQPSITQENNMPKKSRIELTIERHEQKNKLEIRPTSFVERIKNSDGTVKTLY